MQLEVSGIQWWMVYLFEASGIQVSESLPFFSWVHFFEIFTLLISILFHFHVDYLFDCRMNSMCGFVPGLADPTVDGLRVI